MDKSTQVSEMDLYMARQYAAHLDRGYYIPAQDMARYQNAYYRVYHRLV